MDTIVALATAPGRGAIGLLRLSGPSSLSITQSLIRESQFTPEPARVVLKSIKEPLTGEVVDRVLITYFQAPNSFTGEDVIEISCHGSPVVVRYIMDLILKLEGRPAGPGEFTMRALANGKMNLSQAEGIRDLINAQTQAAAKQAARQLNGQLSNQLKPIKKNLVEIASTLESALEFVEDDLPATRSCEIQEKLDGIVREIEALASTYSVGHLLRDGLSVAIVGRPNAGKSSLFNRLLKTDRAIVTDVPGTTRDSLSEPINIDGVPVLLTDTAGMRRSADQIESIGVERTRRAIADADLALIVIDGSTGLSGEDEEVLSSAKQTKYIVALNKADLPSFDRRSFPANGSRIVRVSAKTGAGLDELRGAVLESFGAPNSEDAGLLITDSRHYDLLRRAKEEVESARTLAAAGAGEELVLVGVYNGLGCLGQITGETTTEDILSQIFSTFCIGK
jgi:tRNA modification GTPase